MSYTVKQLTAKLVFVLGAWELLDKETKERLRRALERR